MGASTLLIPRRNCWRRAHAGRVAFVVDAAAYFAAVAEALERARHSVFMLGWDFHSRVRLRRDGRLRDWPDDLVGMLNAAAERNRKLHIYVLAWDFYMVYQREREFLPLLRFGAQAHRRVQFRLDDRYPAGGSHHQKIIVVDDAVAFSGGIDIAAARWDTPEHLLHDSRRNDPGFENYGPFHDVQMAVDGEAAAALADLARERWHRAGGRRVRAVKAEHDPWPPGLAVDVTDVDVAIARTEPQFEGREETREVERAYVDSIAAARNWIYIENQYITSYKIRDALSERLSQKDGPEIILVAPRTCSGWLEHRTMGAMRDIFIDQLRAADRFDRFRIYYPTHGNERDIFVHSKLMIVDDRILRIGSANLANRSMGLDTECDLLIESDGEPRIAQAIAGFQNRLLGEHLGLEAEEVGEAVNATRSLLAAIETLRGSGRSLQPVENCEKTWLEDLHAGLLLLDPERPVGVEQLEKMMAVELPSEEGKRTLARPLLAVVTLLLLGGLWYSTPLRDWVTPEHVAAVAEPLRHGPAGPFLWASIFTLAGMLMVPLTALIVASALLFGPNVGAAISLGAGVASAAGGYLMGQWLWRDTVRRFAGPRLSRISREVGERGILSIVAVRLVPVAPFTVVNMVAGASHVGLRDFVLGSALGMAPGIAGISILSNRAAALVTDPGAGSLAVLLVVALLFGGALLWLRRRFMALGNA